uniref:Large ribosomal subunit protein uL4c n=1 Tax=Renouxia sp. TaxID=2485823 RepID=A0A3G3MHE0_9FLOR|nr:ribosomal protein L4 [Renouxia sp.]
MTIQKELTYTTLSSENITNQIIKVPFHIDHSKGMYIIHRALVRELEKKRQGSAHSKTRSEVRGGGKKPWKQKGTGRARAGSIRSPLWKGGGVIFGPQFKQYNHKINKKEKQLALKILLFNKLNNTILVENFEINSVKPSTKLVIAKLNALKIQKSNKILVIVAKKDFPLYLSIRNIKNLELIVVNQINILSILKAQTIIIESEALSIIEKIYNE